MRREFEPRRIARNAALAGVLAVTGVGLQASATNEVDGATVRSYSCSSTVDKWVTVYPNELTVIKASAVVVPGDKDVNGVKQTDNLGETATVLGLKTKDNTNKNWILGNQYGASAFVLKCGSNFSRFYSALGKEITRADVKLGLNNPTKSVQAQIIEQ